MKRLFKIENMKKIKSILLKNIFKFLSFFKKIKFKIFKIKKYLIIFLFLILLFLLIFSIKNFLSKEEILEVQTENIKKNDSLLEEELKMEEIVNKSKEETVYGELGDFWIEINTEDLQIKAPIVEGISGKNREKDNEILDRGVGHHTLTSFPNRESGNVVLSGHRWYPGDIPARTVFINLDKLKIDDEIKLYYENQEFVYKITDYKIIEVKKDGTQKGDIDIFKETENPTITMYTCEPKYTLGIPTKRLVYFGELVE